MKFLLILIFSACLYLAACKQKQPEYRKLDMTQFTFATPEELASVRVEFTQTDMRLIQDILASASRVLSNERTLKQELSVLGKEDYYVPKLTTEEIRCESPRVLRRLHTLRRWSHEQEIKPFFTRGARTRCPHGARTPRRVPIIVGHH
jgi:hypothetical protein